MLELSLSHLIDEGSMDDTLEDALLPPVLCLNFLPFSVCSIAPFVTIFDNLVFGIVKFDVVSFELGRVEGCSVITWGLEAS